MKRMIMGMLLLALVITISFPTQVGFVSAQGELLVTVAPPALIVCEQTLVRVSVVDSHGEPVEGASVYEGSTLEGTTGKAGVVEFYRHAKLPNYPAGYEITVMKEGFRTNKGTIKVFKERCEDYESLMEIGKLVLQALALARGGGGKQSFKASDTPILSWEGTIRLESGEIVDETATSIEGEIYVSPMGPEQALCWVNFTQLKINFAPSYWGGIYTGNTSVVLDTYYPSTGLMNTTSGEIVMSFRTRMTNNILKKPAVELGWFSGYFDETTGLLTLHGQSVVIAWPGYGGFTIAVNKLNLLAPYIGVASAIIVGTVVTAVCFMRFKRRREKQL